MTHRGTRKRGRRRKASTDHVVCDLKHKVMRCRRCGDTAPLNLPALVDVFARRAKGFSELHRDCAPKEVAGHG